MDGIKSGRIKLSVNISMTQRYNFAVAHLMAASQFADKASIIDDANSGSVWSVYYEELKPYVTSAIILSVCSIEANINENIEDAHAIFDGLPKNSWKPIGELFDKLPILSKYDKALEIRDLPPFDRGSNPYQAADALVALRNGLVHFYPERSDNLDKLRKISQKLHGKFEPNASMSENAPLFPMRYVSKSCANWAVTTALTFMKEFEQRIGAKPKFEKFQLD